jgi:hypothetical protein
LEAIRLGRALVELMPDEPEVHGLLALMLLNDARRDARFADGTVVLLRDRDRSLWDGAKSPRDGQRSIERSHSAAAVPTCCRRRSHRSTSRRLRTGRSSRLSTASSRAARARQSSSSTERRFLERRLAALDG